MFAGQRGHCHAHGDDHNGRENNPEGDLRQTNQYIVTLHPQSQWTYGLSSARNFHGYLPTMSVSVLD